MGVGDKTESTHDGPSYDNNDLTMMMVLNYGSENGGAGVLQETFVVNVVVVVVVVVVVSVVGC